MALKSNSTEFPTAVSVSRMRELDAYTIANFTPSRELMRRAADGVFQNVNWNSKTTAIVVGGGNNGGDGYALACILADSGFSPTVVKVSEKLSEDGAYYCNLALSKGVPVVSFSDNLHLSGYDIIVDCIFGTGFTGEPRGSAAAAIREINISGAYVVSVDINSGLNGDTGDAVLAVKSNLTVSIGFYKTGLFIGKAPSLIGKLVNVDIGLVCP